MERTMKPTSDWRSLIKVHPAAELFDLLPPDELKTLAESIRANGLLEPVKTWFDGDHQDWLLDGRNRLDALVLLGVEFTPADGGGISTHQSLEGKTFIVLQPAKYDGQITGNNELDPYHYIIAANIRRRHLSVDDRKRLAAEILKQRPEMSDRSVAKETKLSPSTVGEVRKEVEGTVQTGQLETEPAKRIGRDGKARKARKRPAKSAQPTTIDADTGKRRPLTEEENAQFHAYLADPFANVKPGCCVWHDTGGSLNLSCGDCDMGGTRQPEPLPAPSSPPAQPEPSIADQLAACPEWRMLTNPVTEAEMSQEYHSVIATLGKIREPLERRLIERWINAHWNANWQPEAVAAE